MSELTRLAEGGSTFERALLGAGRDESPSRSLEEKILASLEVPLPLPPAASARAARDPSPARWLGSGGAAVAAAGAGALLVGALLVGREPAPASAAPAPASAAPAPASPAPASAAPAPASPAPAPASPALRDGALVAVTPASLPDVAPAAASAIPGRAGAGGQASTAPGDRASAEGRTIALEVALLDAVRSRLGAGDASGALRSLDTYDTEIPTGALRPEATVLRIRALLLQGDRGAAEAAAADLLRRRPDSVHAKRVRALLGR